MRINDVKAPSRISKGRRGKTAPLFELQKTFKVLTDDLWPKFCGLLEKEGAFSF
jgi:hypothetical protein